ncbi:unnamed protein product [Leptidea sinapis]|uniref:Uncharacterized protein n=1 Tax=Leptidea sinapis TaxID=189913 RepID=A0A5E4PVQ0_9NEOP|nr:unnamed protein product [Leptidea sinapis]
MSTMEDFLQTQEQITDAIEQVEVVTDKWRFGVLDASLRVKVLEQRLQLLILGVQSAESQQEMQWPNILLHKTHLLAATDELHHQPHSPIVCKQAVLSPCSCIPHLVSQVPVGTRPDTLMQEFENTAASDHRLPTEYIRNAVLQCRQFKCYPFRLYLLNQKIQIKGIFQLQKSIGKNRDQS